MELEQRVKALEYEIKILKNEIQRTLLDIQEQVLIHYYPTLRADDSVPPADAVAHMNRSANAAGPVATGTPAAPPPAPVMAKKVSLDDVRAMPTPAPVASAPVATAAVAPAPQAPGGADQNTMVRLMEWVNEAMAKLGAGRTSDLIELCAARAILDNETRALMLRLTALNKAPEPELVPANDAITVVLRLDEVLGRAADMDEALTIIEEANIG